jgi:hypothetical protein
MWLLETHLSCISTGIPIPGKWVIAERLESYCSQFMRSLGRLKLFFFVFHLLLNPKHHNIQQTRKIP